MTRRRKAAAKGSLLDRLEAHEGLEVLRRLTRTDSVLRARAVESADTLLGEVSFKQVADRVELGIGALDLDDLGARAGRHSWGYVEPTEAAWNLVEETVKPFMDDLERRIEMGRREEALEVCKGIVLGLYRVEEEGGNQILEYALDSPAETAAWAVDLLKGKAGARSQGAKGASVLPPDFVEMHVPKWKTFLLPKPSKRGGKRGP